MLSAALLTAAAATAPAFVKAFKTGPIRYVDVNNPPHQFWPGDQAGYNDCQNYADSAKAECQNLWLNSLDDMCLFAPPKVATVGASERYEVAYCNKAGHGTRLMPKGTITGASLVRTPQYIQIRGTADLTKINVSPKNDGGGELDPWGYDKKGNPIGGIVITTQNNKAVQAVQWMSFIARDEFCIRACWPTDADAYGYCAHQYDVMGCDWVMPGHNKAGLFETCEGAAAQKPGQYVLKNGTTSTWTQGHKPTPSAHPIPASSKCATQKTMHYDNYASSKPTPSKHANHADDAAQTPKPNQHKQAHDHKAAHHKMAKSTTPKATGPTVHKPTPKAKGAHKHDAREADL